MGRQEEGMFFLGDLQTITLGYVFLLVLRKRVRTCVYTCTGRAVIIAVAAVIFVMTATKHRILTECAKLCIVITTPPPDMEKFLQA